MTVSLSSADFRVVKSPPPMRGFRPEALMEAGILTNPKTAHGALRRARALVSQGQYLQARQLLQPHSRSAPEIILPRITELLALCAPHTGGDWQPLMKQSLAGYEKNGGPPDHARVQRNLGRLLLVSGRFRDADRHLEVASKLYDSFEETTRSALTDCLRGHIRMRIGRIGDALSRVDNALKRLVSMGPSRAEGLARLDRARILAHMGDSGNTAKELVAAERLLVTSGNGTDRVRSRLARAETLLLLGNPERAAAGLERLRADVNEIEDVTTRAWVQALLGRSLAVTDPAGARRHLMRARHLFETIGSAWGVATSEIALGRVELRIGLNGYGRVRGLAEEPLQECPLLDAELRVLKAEVIAEHKPHLAKELLLRSRSFGFKHSNRYLVRDIDDVLLTRGLLNAAELATLPSCDTIAVPLEAEDTANTIVIPAPQPMEETSVVLFDVERAKEVDRLLGRGGKNNPGFKLVHPRTFGINTRTQEPKAG